MRRLVVIDQRHFFHLVTALALKPMFFPIEIVCSLSVFSNLSVPAYGWWCLRCRIYRGWRIATNAMNIPTFYQLLVPKVARVYDRRWPGVTRHFPIVYHVVDFGGWD